MKFITKRLYLFVLLLILALSNFVETSTISRSTTKHRRALSHSKIQRRRTSLKTKEVLLSDVPNVIIDIMTNEINDFEKRFPLIVGATSQFVNLQDLKEYLTNEKMKFKKCDTQFPLSKDQEKMNNAKTQVRKDPNKNKATTELAKDCQAGQANCANIYESITNFAASAWSYSLSITNYADCIGKIFGEDLGSNAQLKQAKEKFIEEVGNMKQTVTNAAYEYFYNVISFGAYGSVKSVYYIAQIYNKFVELQKEINQGVRTATNAVRKFNFNFTIGEAIGYGIRIIKSLLSLRRRKFKK